MRLYGGRVGAAHDAPSRDSAARGDTALLPRGSLLDLLNLHPRKLLRLARCVCVRAGRAGRGAGSGVVCRVTQRTRPGARARGQCTQTCDAQHLGPTFQGPTPARPALPDPTPPPQVRVSACRAARERAMGHVRCSSLSGTRVHTIYTPYSHVPLLHSRPPAVLTMSNLKHTPQLHARPYYISRPPHIPVTHTEYALLHAAGTCTSLSCTHTSLLDARDQGTGSSAVTQCGKRAQAVSSRDLRGSISRRNASSSLDSRARGRRSGGRPSPDTPLAMLLLTVTPASSLVAASSTCLTCTPGSYSASPGARACMLRCCPRGRVHGGCRGIREWT